MIAPSQIRVLSALTLSLIGLFGCASQSMWDHAIWGERGNTWIRSGTQPEARVAVTSLRQVSKDNGGFINGDVNSKLCHYQVGFGIGYSEAIVIVEDTPPDELRVTIYSRSFDQDGQQAVDRHADAIFEWCRRTYRPPWETDAPPNQEYNSAGK